MREWTGSQIDQKTPLKDLLPTPPMGDEAGERAPIAGYVCNDLPF
jgi:hypothetical protein